MSPDSFLHERSDFSAFRKAAPPSAKRLCFSSGDWGNAGEALVAEPIVEEWPRSSGKSVAASWYSKSDW
jgi:hypothetical protein